MATPFFKFKQFTVFHDQCAMKVGTDGVLLGAWTAIDQAASILDVGTGTGLVALMLAQRAKMAHIDAIDIDLAAYRQAVANVSASPFAEQIRVVHASFARFDTHEKYDLIVSNPPYFSRSLKNPDAQRAQARHDDDLPLEQLLEGSKNLLTPQGRIALILPVEHDQRLRAIALRLQLYRTRQTNVCPVQDGPVRRLLVELSPTPCPDIIPECLPIEIERNQYTEAYKKLTREYYLNM